MQKKKAGYALKQEKRRSRIKSALLSLVFITLSVLPANAGRVYRDSDWNIQWDNTVKYSAGYRLTDRENGLLADPNSDDGNRNFDRGFTSNRLDLLSELDITHGNFGLRVSGAGWVDSIYLEDNDNDSPGTFNGTGPNDEFSDATEKLNGLKADLLDAFVFWRGTVGSRQANFRAGRHTMLWGETLYFAANGIAYGQAPLDLGKALGVPGTQAKEVFMPVGQFSGQIELVKNLTFAAFWQFEWRRSRVPASGSYFSDTDVFDAGGQRILLGGPAFFRGDDLGGGESITSEFGEGNWDQYGFALRFRSGLLNTEFGLYYVHYNEHSTYWAYIDPTKVDLSIGKVGEYFLVFPEDVHMVGGSFGTQFGPVNVSGEVSARFDTPLISVTSVIAPGTSADGDNHPLYAIGDTLHANLSAIYFMGAFKKLWDGANFYGEIGYTYLMDTTENEAAFDATRDDYALGFRLVFEPAYYQAFPGIDIRVPIGLGYSPKGRSPVDLKFNNGGADEGGDVSIGLNIDYLIQWKFGIKYTNYFGSDDTQHLTDRDFISISVQRTF